MVKKIVDGVLERIAPQLDAIYAERGRPSIPPETLLKAQVLIEMTSRGPAKEVRTSQSSTASIRSMSPGLTLRF